MLTYGVRYKSFDYIFFFQSKLLKEIRTISAKNFLFWSHQDIKSNYLF